MPINRSRIRKGVFLARPPAKRRPADYEQLAREFPEFEATIREGGSGRGPAFDREPTAIRELARRLEIVREQLKSPRGK